MQDNEITVDVLLSYTWPAFAVMQSACLACEYLYKLIYKQNTTTVAEHWITGGIHSSCKTYV